jgi:S-adenosylmethionine hydrolase
MSVITLTTDFGTKDHYVGVLKGKIISELPNATIIDISHHVDVFNVVEASYMIASSYHAFPKGTVHIIGVDAALSLQDHIAVLWEDQYFICADNGILSLLTQRIVPEKIVKINIHDRLHENATAMDVFITVACHLSKGGSMNVIGKEIPHVKEIRTLKPVLSDDGKTLKGNVIYIDHFGNVISDISKKVFQEVGKNRSFTLHAKNYKFQKIYNNYGSFVPEDSEDTSRFEGERLAIFNENDLIEIGIYRSNHYTSGSASTLLGLQYRDSIIISFE